MKIQIENIYDLLESLSVVLVAVKKNGKCSWVPRRQLDLYGFIREIENGDSVQFISLKKYDRAWWLLRESKKARQARPDESPGSPNFTILT